MAIGKPLSISEVSNTVSAGTHDLGTLCKSENINKFAKYKPFVAIGTYKGTLFFEEDTDPSKTDRYWALKLAHYGLKLECNALGHANNDGGYGLSNILPDARNGYLPTVVHIHPSGGSDSAYRLADFINYNHSAKKPIWPETYESKITGSENGSVTLYFYYNDGIDDTEIHLKELDFIQGDNDYYLGYLLFNNSKAFVATTQQKLSTIPVVEAIAITFDNVCSNGTDSTCITSLTGENFNLVPFICTDKLPATKNMSKESLTYYGTIYPLTFAQTSLTIARYDSSTQDPIVISSAFVGCFAANNNTSTVNGHTISENIYWDIYIRNNQSDTTVNGTLSIYLSWGGSWTRTITLEDITIPPKSSYYGYGDSQYPDGCQLVEAWTSESIIAQKLLNGGTVNYTLTFKTSSISSYTISGTVSNMGDGDPSKT